MGSGNLRLSTRLWLAVGLMAVLLASVLGGSGFFLIRNESDGDARLREMGARVKAATTWAGMTGSNSVRTQAVILTNEKEVENAFKDEIAATSAKISEIQKSIEAMPLSEADKAQMAKIAGLRKAMLALRTQVKELKANQQREEAVSVIQQKYVPSVSTYLDALREFVQMQEHAMAALEAEVQGERTRTFWISGILVTIITVGIVMGAARLIYSIQRPLQEANHLAAEIAQGNLGVRIDVSRQDEFGDLMRSLASMNQSLGRLVAQVRQSVDRVAAASAEIAAGNRDLSQRTEEAASQLEQTASSMEELTQTVRQSTDHAQQASTLVNEASLVASRGGSMVGQVVATMQDINSSSQKIADIIGVIDSIAFQTNILALNAAVEAARAGEQGRGFAVVASEVRTLAQRSAVAAKEIKDLIASSVDKVGSGTRLVNDTGATMAGIVESVQRVSDMIGELNRAATEERTGIENINESISHLDQATQQNSALVEESVATMNSLREQAEQLSELVAVFKLA